MSEENSEKRTLAPHFILIGVVVVVILAVVFWPTSEPEPKPEPVKVAPPVTQPEPEPAKPEVFESTPEPEPVEIDPNADVEPMAPTPELEPEPLDTSDAAIKASLSDISTSSQVNQILVNDGLLQRFVVSVTNLANNEMAPNHQLLKAPDQAFRVYTQAGKQWVDAASYKRYTPYVDVLESFDNSALLDLFKVYSDDIQAKYAEISDDPDKPFAEVMANAIDTLLNTPEVPMPVEVYTDSVMYKYADPRLEALSAPQKQLLRTGPDNMRRIKAKLRELKDMLQQDGSQ